MVARAVAVLVCALLLTGCAATLDDRAKLDRALPTAADMRGFSASGGVFTVLTDPKGRRVGRLALAGDQLDAPCARYRKQGDAWACDGLRGLGVASFQDDRDVASRVCTFVLGFRSAGAAKKAYRQAVAQTREELHSWDDDEPSGYGDESLQLTAETGTDLVVRKGAVVAIVTAHSENGYRVAGESWTLNRLDNPFDRWAKVQERRLDRAL